LTSGDLYKRGSHYFKEKSWKNAIRFFSRAIKLDEEFSDAYIKRGKAYCEQDEPMYNLALLDFNKALNFPCAYNAFTTCPIPPERNRLTFLVEIATS